MKGFRAESTPMTTTLEDHVNGPDSLGALLSEQLRRNPGVPLQLLRKGLSVSPSFQAAIEELLEEILKDAQGPVALTVMSNAATDLNPWSGLAAASEKTPGSRLLEDLVTLLGPGEVMEWQRWPDHFTLLSAQAIEVLAGPDTTVENALMRLHDAGGLLLLGDSIFLHDPSADLFHEDPLAPHERRRPAAWGLLRQRLDDWLKLPGSGLSPPWKGAVSDFRRSEKPVTLHVTHSWGGGVAKWVESFIEADESGINFQLRSEDMQSGKGYGQRFSLYLDNQLDAPVANWWLQPAIRSTSGGHRQYCRMLREISERYGVGRLVISSLVGHSMDALATGLPTIQVLHDFYPLWPLLGIHPGPYLGNGPESCLEKALQDHPLLPGFLDRNAGGWRALGRQWRNSIENWGVRVTAPSRSVADLIRLLDPGWSGIDIEIIPHGLPELPGSDQVRPKDREDGRLRLVIPGRIQEGKGKRLLLEALPELTEFAQVYLLGAGKDAEAFFGKSGVDVIIQYRRDDLRGILAQIGPHVAGLLSIVPETFSYTLSEMQQLNIPVIATRVGSLEERISDGETGWLIEPEASSLIDRVRTLAQDRGKLRSTRERLEDFDLPGTGQMVSKYEKICLPRPASRSLNRVQNLDEARASALAFQMTDLAARNRNLSDRNEALQEEVEKRSAWAEAREKERKKEVERRIRWVGKLEGFLQESQDRLQLTQERLEETRVELEHEQVVHRQANLRLEELGAVHEWVLATASWRITRPFRVLGRMFRNLGQARAWNPFRWPLLLSQAVRTVGTQGFRGALERSQSTRTKHQTPESPDPPSIESIGHPEPPSAFPALGNPEVSVVIPVHNKWVYTAACLRSLAETRCSASFEVIVVDDHSSDQTPERLPEVEGLVSIRNEQNPGFVGSCNRGAEAARGRYLVMLNNDTQVLDGWLDALIETFTHHPDTGIAGASLIYPDGTLQEAGGIVFRDGSGWNYGKGDQADRPEYQYTREVDYCSGACIMLETSLFRDLDGFDTYYAPAYYEDTDLAFRVRARGLKVRVQPAAAIVHHEGITSGTDLNEGAKRYQAVNRKKFLERWGDEIASYPNPINDPSDDAEIRQARDHRLKGRVLVIDAYTPEPDQDSGSVRLCYLMGCLASLGYGVTFMADNRAHAGKYTVALQQAGVEVVYEPWIESLSRFFGERGADYDFVMVSRHYVASNYLSLLKRYCPQAKFIFDTVDLHYLREERMAELENSLPLRRAAAQTRRSELAVINAADATIVVSPVEKTVLERAAPEAKVHVISNVHELVGSQRPFADRKDIFFVGGYQHPPNIDAALWFVGRIWPLIRKELPKMEFHLIGSKAPEKIRTLDGNGVRFHGFVKSLEPWLDGCRLAVAPIRYGAGIKGKVNISMSRGQPVVATPMAVEGMFAQSGREVLVAETAEDFAAEVIRLYNDENLWNRVSEAGLENVRQYFSVETARLGLQQLLKSLG
jgi:GT2 family glycosyltransferase